MKYIYLDNAATTRVAPEVLEAMTPYFTEYYGNPSSIYSFAGKSKDAMEEARAKIAGILGAKPEEIYFTGGGSESDNWALKATAEAYANKGKHIITSTIELLKSSWRPWYSGYQVFRPVPVPLSLPNPMFIVNAERGFIL